jgi:hypothetical protein
MRWCDQLHARLIVPCVREASFVQAAGAADERKSLETRRGRAAHRHVPHVGQGPTALWGAPHSPFSISTVSRSQHQAFLSSRHHLHI